jgi:hypothetical protein
VIVQTIQFPEQADLPLGPYGTYAYLDLESSFISNGNSQALLAIKSCFLASQKSSLKERGVVHIIL